MNTGTSRGYSPILVTAALSVAVLVSATGMQLGKTFAEPQPIDPSTLKPVAMPSYVAIEDADGNGTPDWQDELTRSGIEIPVEATSTLAIASSSDPLSTFGSVLAQSLIGGYLSLKEYDAYTPGRGEQLANTVVDNFHAPEIFVPYTVDDLILDADTSESRALQYRGDMRVALVPLITDEEHELTLFAAFVETRNQAWLDRLAKAATNYRAAEKNMLSVRIPQDAAPEHLRVMNALGAYAENLERMVRFANDPLASMALLRTYNDKERDFDLAFDGLVKYYARKIGDN